MTGSVAALDLGGTHASAGRVDLESSLVEARARVALPASADRECLLASIVEVLSDASDGTDRIGVAAPGPFDYGGGVSWIEHKLEPLLGVNLRAELAARLDVPTAAISFVNDAEAFLLGEWWSGAATGHDRAVGITLGTGLGSAFLESGRPVRSGSRVPPAGAIYLVPYRGATVEETVSREALIARYGEPQLDVEEIAVRARSGDERAQRAFFEVAEALGEAVAPWLRSFGASCLVVGGSIARAWDLLEPKLRRVLQCLPRLEVVARAQHIDDAALLGAARHAVDPRVPETRADAQVKTLRGERIEAGARPLHTLTVEEARAEQDVPTKADALAHAVEVVDLRGPVPLRLYRPIGPTPQPVCVWLPGGGWVLDTHAASEAACRRLAAETPCAVLAVRYRLAPEHPFPAALADCLAAVEWVAADGAARGLDAARIAIGGTSAGANLAAAVALVARERDDLRVAAQVLVYPPLLHGSETESMQAGGDWVFLDRRGVEWCWSHYLSGPCDGNNPLASPLRATDLRGLPRTLVVTAELDPLRDEGELYAQRLRAAGVQTTATRFDGVPHGFFSLTGRLAAADRAQELAVSVLRDTFSEGG